MIEQSYMKPSCKIVLCVQAMKASSIMENTFQATQKGLIPEHLLFHLILQ